MINCLMIWPEYLLHIFYRPGYMKKTVRAPLLLKPAHIAHHKKYNTQHTTKHNSLLGG